MFVGPHGAARLPRYHFKSPVVSRVLVLEEIEERAKLVGANLFNDLLLLHEVWG